MIPIEAFGPVFIFVIALIVLAFFIESISIAINKRKMADPYVLGFWKDFDKTRKTINSCLTIEQLQVAKNMVVLFKAKYHEYTSLEDLMNELSNLVEYREICLEKPTES